MFCRTEIEWHQGKCLTQKLLKKKPKKGSKNAKPITKTENCESFFNFFNPPQVPEEDEDIDEDAVSLSSLKPFKKIALVINWSSILLYFLMCRLKNFKTRWNKIMTLGEFLTCNYLPWRTILDSSSFCGIGVSMVL